ncbi:uncharacterized protein BDW70DRAFT_112971 [Aspergillus foveolatus]|uniref:uncharacterized protein n=1 Tax=Aspergillus foveolatus TaxID=210207 RepID=UPI003CCE3193
MNSSSASASFIISTAIRLSLWLLTPLLWCQKSRRLGFPEDSHSSDLGANKLHCCLDLCPVSPVRSHEDQTLLFDNGCTGVNQSLLCRSDQLPAAVRKMVRNDAEKEIACSLPDDLLVTHPVEKIGEGTPGPANTIKANLNVRLHQARSCSIRGRCLDAGRQRPCRGF